MRSLGPGQEGLFAQVFIEHPAATPAKGRELLFGLPQGIGEIPFPCSDHSGSLRRNLIPGSL
jgi:hypothetical protein